MRLAAALLFASTVLGACSEKSLASRHLLVFAAASLTEPFRELANAFEQQHPGTKVDLHFAGTPRLVLQIREGAPADVFASADEANMDRALATRASNSKPRTFAHNHLSIVVPAGNPRGIRRLADLTKPGLRVALCGPTVPAGRYARKAMDKAGIEIRSISDEPSVKAIVSKIRLGELDAGIVYSTDVRAARGQVEGIEIPDQHNMVCAYPIAVLKTGPRTELGSAFVNYVLSDRGQSVLRRHGFANP